MSDKGNRELLPETSKTPDTGMREGSFVESDVTHPQQHRIIIDIPGDPASSPLQPSDSIIGRGTCGTATLTLSWKDIHYSVSDRKGKAKEILKGVSGEALPGEMIGIMGSSGAGKSTLLNILAGRVSSGIITGQVTVNGRQRTKAWKKITGYVEQEDVMYRTLTVKETLEYTALLRLPNLFTRKQKLARVDQVITELGLKGCENTIIGDGEHRGVSGGERKRVAIGIELVANPRLLFLDEPTSGLDSFTAFNVVSLVGKQAELNRRTIIMTIHQPRTDILKLFKKILLISQGKTIFYGSLDDALAHFAHLGFNCPPLINPADFFLDLITVDVRTHADELESQRRVEYLQEAWQAQESELFKRPISLWRSTVPMEEIDPLLDLLPQEAQARHLAKSKSNKKPSSKACSTDIPKANDWFAEFYILLCRNFKNEIRDTVTVFAGLFQSIFLMLFIGFVFFQLSLDQIGLQARIGALFFVSVQTVFNIVIPIISLFPLERLIILRERAAYTYRVSSFYVAKATSIVPFRLFNTAVFALGIYYIIGLNPLARNYFIFVAILLNLAFAAISLGLLIGASVSSVRLGLILGPLLVVMMLVFGGNLVNGNSVTWILQWMKYLSIIYYTYSALAQNEFDGESFICSNGQVATPQAPCTPGFSTGEELLAHYGLNAYSITADCLILLGISFGFQFLAYLALRITTKPKIKLV